MVLLVMDFAAASVVHNEEVGAHTVYQVRSITKFYSVDFSKSRIDVKKVRFLQTHNQGLRQLFLTVVWDLHT